MNLDFYIKKKHLFKQRKYFKPVINDSSKFQYNYIYSVTKTRLEFVYIRIFKKLFRRRYIKAKIRFFKPKYWITFLPNFILTQKSKNARMGAGVGKIVRLTSLVYPGKSFIKTWFYDLSYLQSVVNYLTYKLKSKLLIKIVTNQ